MHGNRELFPGPLGACRSGGGAAPGPNDASSDADRARFERNRSWRSNPDIPPWVNIETAGLDRFFTRAEVAARCHASFLRRMEQDGVDARAYAFVEPGAGAGAFYDLLPQERRIGIDILPERAEIVRADFLGWRPPRGGARRYAAIGNPPFGYRAWLALAFVNRAARFADYVGMILPMAFQSEGKGSPRHRVNGLRLLHSEILPPDSFEDAGGRTVKINALWQIWRRGANRRARAATCSEWLDLFTVDMRKQRLCGQARLGEADWFLQRTFFESSPPKPVRRFQDVRYGCGYGLVVKKEKQRIAALLNDTDWVRYSNLAAHNCRHIGMYHIRNALTDAGCVDG